MPRNNMLRKEDILAYLRKKAGRPLPFRELSSRMGVRNTDRRRFKRLLRDLVDEGEVVRTKRGLYGSSVEMAMVTGHFEAHREGFGFVIQEAPGQKDVFIPARATASAMNGDRVVAQVEDTRRRSGRIVRVLERSRAKVAGTIDRAGDAYFLKPKSKSISFDIYIQPRDTMGLEHGDKALVEITEYPTGKRPAMGKVVKELARTESASDEVGGIIEEFALPKRFSSKLSKEAEALRDKPFGKRKDLTALATVTIDGETARDFDDAVSIKENETGYRLWVHIADVGHYVPWDSPLDIEARRRGTSVYFPGRVVPMLPKALSEDLCSLRPGEDRPAFTIQMDFDLKGKRRGGKFFKSLIRSDQRMTYTSVSRIIEEHHKDERLKYAALLKEFDLMADLAGVMRNKRLARGSLDFDLPEPEILLDVQGRPEDIVRSERNFAHMLIEEFMIAANEAVAEGLAARGVPCLYRIHEEPDEGKVEQLIGSLMLPGLRQKKYTSPKDLHRLLKAVKGTKEEEVVMYQVLRSLKQARYSEQNAGHFGLASKCYLHFTSPIRRYPDLVCHRVLAEALEGRGIPKERKRSLGQLMPLLAFSSSMLERKAVEAERAAVDALRAWFMKDKVGEEFAATVTGVSPNGIRLRLVEYYVEGFIPVSDLTDDYYLYNEREVALKGRHSGRKFAFGSELAVRVDRVDLEERRVIFGV